MAEASYLAAFFGGVLSLLSPCSALLLPAFFAYAFQSGGRILFRTVVFYVGLAATLVPLGMGISAVSGLFYGHRAALILISGLILIGLGVLQLAGKGFSVGPVARLQSRIKGDSVLATFALGAVYGFAGFCSGPILGAVLTVAASSGQAVHGAALLAVYAAGMAAPLFFMALLWTRFDLGHRRWLRGREVSLGPLRLHTTNLISGVMFVLLGLAFIFYQGTSALSGLYESNGAVDFAFSAQQWANGLAGTIPGYTILVALAALVAGFLISRLKRGEPKKRNTFAQKKEERTKSRR